VLTKPSAHIVYVSATDPKIRVRAIKKGVTLGDLTHYYTTPPAGTLFILHARCAVVPMFLGQFYL
jgi:hypothetical protein